MSGDPVPSGASDAPDAPGAPNPPDAQNAPNAPAVGSDRAIQLAPADAGARIVQVDVVGTAALLAATVLASVVDSDWADAVNLAVSTVLFLGGCVAFAVGFVRAANRSRTEVLDLAGLFYLTGSAPTEVRRRMLGLWFAQIAVAAVSVATVSPPFGVMAPVWGIGLLTLWSARHGAFPRRALQRR